MIPGEASKRDPIFDEGTYRGSDRLRLVFFWGLLACRGCLGRGANTVLGRAVVPGGVGLGLA